MKTPMKHAASIIFSWVLAVGLTLYGPLGMAAAQTSGASFTMEICADGFAETVLVDSGGTPVNPSHDCQDCLVCSHAMAGTLDINSGKRFTFSQITSAADLPAFATPYIHTYKTRPMPRGPPLGHVTRQTTSNLFSSDQAYDGQKTYGDGRPPLKDATA
ncbi:hypothetical protein [Lentibacter sp. XHP0401]|uniref:hypothetical protein n=1 Tax=Lentibacter sp. XHP0401 TaxID=2984334 RepID=UPI0021E89CC0|nr:hypothetical protein [Lentibacter sp. XHP0401]MCV2891971.1 hypothetical protein [Lentibacter sp. XHP0401]